MQSFFDFQPRVLQLQFFQIRNASNPGSSTCKQYASRTSNVELCFRTEPYTVVSNAASSHNTFDRLFIAHIITLLAISHFLRGEPNWVTRASWCSSFSTSVPHSDIPTEDNEESHSQETNKSVPVAGISPRQSDASVNESWSLHFLSVRYIFLLSV